MQEFFRDVGFEIADNWTVSVVVAGAVVTIGLLLAYTALRDSDALGEYRVLALIVGFAMSVGTVAALPLLRQEAEDACTEWARSPAPADELHYVENECAALFTALRRG